MISRFDAAAPLRLEEVSVWLVTGSKGGSVDVVLYGHEGGFPFPYQMKQIMQPVRIDVAARTDSLYRLLFREPILFDRPTQFFVGVINRSPDVHVRMDRTAQAIPCSHPSADTMFTSMFAIRDPVSSAYRFGVRGANGRLISNWYIGAEGTYIRTASPPLFTDVSREARLPSSSQENRRVAWGDFDADGYQDLLWGDVLLHNEGDGSFRDVSRSVGYNIGSQVNMFVDIDNDGDLDIVCQPRNFIYRNEEGRFSFVSDPGLNRSENTQAMAFADWNGDTYPDAIVVNGESTYYRRERNPGDSTLIEGIGSPSYLYLNRAGKGFTDSTSALHGYTAEVSVRHAASGRVFSGHRVLTCAQWVDFDTDGDLDLFLGADHLQPNYLFENRGEDGFFDVAQDFQVSDLDGTIAGERFGNTSGCDIADFDNDGAPDLATAESALPYQLPYSEVSSVWRSEPASTYQRRLRRAVLLAYAARQADLAWGDFDNDGLQDLFVSSGVPCYRSSLFRQLPDHTFADVAYETGTGIENVFGAAWADFDNDGDLDLALVTGSELRLLRNETHDTGNWIELNLRSKTENVYAIGATVRIHTPGRTVTRFVTAGKGAGSQQPYTVHAGIGASARIDSVVIIWPGGRTYQTERNPTLNRIVSVIESMIPEARVEDPTPKSPNLQQNFPNPFSKSKNATTSIAYNLPAATEIRLEIVDMTGTIVAVLLEKRQEAGIHYVQWDGRNQDGETVAGGSYMYVLSSKGNVLARQLIMLK